MLSSVKAKSRALRNQQWTCLSCNLRDLHEARGSNCIPAADPHRRKYYDPCYQTRRREGSKFKNCMQNCTRTKDCRKNTSLRQALCMPGLANSHLNLVFDFVCYILMVIHYDIPRLGQTFVFPATNKTNITSKLKSGASC